MGTFDEYFWFFNMNLDTINDYLCLMIVQELKYEHDEHVV